MITRPGLAQEAKPAVPTALGLAAQPVAMPWAAEMLRARAVLEVVLAEPAVSVTVVLAVTAVQVEPVAQVEPAVQVEPVAQVEPAVQVEPAERLETPTDLSKLALLQRTE